MWIMNSYGIFMLADTPRDVPTTSWDLQVRARDQRALVKLRKQMLAQDYSVSQIFDTRDRDYEYRMYVRRYEYAALLAAEIGRIDYEKFKPTTCHRGMGGSNLNDLYNHLWYVIAKHYRSPILGSILGYREDK